MHFEKIFVPDNYTGTAQQAFSSVSKQYEDALKHLEAQKQKYQRFLADQAETIVTARKHTSSVFQKISMSGKRQPAPESMKISIFSADG